MSDHVIIRREGRTVRITLNRPEKRNSLTKEMLAQIKEFFQKEAAAKDPALVIIIRGAGNTFCAGFDLNELWEDISNGGENYISEANVFESCFQTIWGHPFPVIAVIEGKAIGGGSILACSCDIRIGVTGMTFGFTPAKLGVVYPTKGMLRLISVVGPTFAREMSLTAKFYDDKKALECGFINCLVNEGQLEETIQEYSRSIQKLSPSALRGIKRQLNIIGSTELDHVELQKILESTTRSDDPKEGIRAFLDKRNPDFSG